MGKFILGVSNEILNEYEEIIERYLLANFPFPKIKVKGLDEFFADLSVGI